jgi:glycosyltransferase involved in cell wall biosynthesis
VTDGTRYRDADKSRQELLDELYYLRDVAGEREQRARELEQQTRDQQQRLAKLAAALRSVLSSRSWRWARPMRDWLHPGRRGTVDRELAELVAAETAAEATQHDVPDEPSVLPGQSSLARTHQMPCVFVDVSELALRNGQTGIQRVVREISRALLASPPKGFIVELVCAGSTEPYKYARAFADRLMERGPASGPDVPIEPRSGDIFLGLDHAMHAVLEHGDELAAMRAEGVELCFVLNDTLPLSRPDWFPPEVSATFKKWFETIFRLGNRIACISQATEADAREWLDRLQVPREHRPVLGWFHLGANGIAENVDGAALASRQQGVPERLRGTTSFLMVGTLEPRKGHGQALEAFNRLWAEGEDLALVLVGRPGWMTEVIQRRIRHHEEFGRRLFWFKDADDGLLDEFYATCTVLLAPSEGEGFGLPLVEAARRGLPILCRGLAVFREVAGEHATYFSGETPLSLADAVREWLAAYKRGETPSSSHMPWLTWDQSARELLGATLIEPEHRATISDQKENKGK